MEPFKSGPRGIKCTLCARDLDYSEKIFQKMPKQDDTITFQLDEECYLKAAGSSITYDLVEIDANQGGCCFPA